MEKITNVFFVIIDKNTGKYFKKSPSSHYGDCLTDKLGRARIFESEAIARTGYNPKQALDENVEFQVVKMIAERVY